MTPIVALIASLAAQAQAAESRLDALEDPLEARSRHCAQLIRETPAAAVQSAETWLAEGGGVPASQCLGLALVALERWEQAALVYEQAARAIQPAQQAVSADLWAQAGNAWIAAGKPDLAIAALDRALADSGLADELRGEIHLDRGRALVALEDVAGARSELDRGLQLVPADPFGWYLSAALAQREGDLSRARTDIGRARTLAPADPDILLLAGTLAGLAGNMEEAERLYRQVATQAPDSRAGRAARASLATVHESQEVQAPGDQPQR